MTLSLCSLVCGMVFAVGDGVDLTPTYHFSLPRGSTPMALLLGGTGGPDLPVAHLCEFLKPRPRTPLARILFRAHAPTLSISLSLTKHACLCVSPLCAALSRAADFASSGSDSWELATSADFVHWEHAFSNRSVRVGDGGGGGGALAAPVNAEFAPTGARSVDANWTAIALASAIPRSISSPARRFFFVIIFGSGPCLPPRSVFADAALRHVTAAACASSLIL